MNHEESKLQQQCVAWFRAQHKREREKLQRIIRTAGTDACQSKNRK